MAVTTTRTAPLEIPPTTAAVPAVRTWLAARLSRWPHPVIEDGKLIGTELATNAVVHVGLPGIFVQVYEGPEAPIIEVRDSSHIPPIFHGTGNALEHGRGLLIVGELAQKCGYSLLPHGKSVWAVLHVPAA
jgi:anti-sigma regulatory factor (Ser/Thr protein kinase)